MASVIFIFPQVRLGHSIKQTESLKIYLGLNQNGFDPILQRPSSEEIEGCATALTPLTQKKP